MFFSRYHLIPRRLSFRSLLCQVVFQLGLRSMAHTANLYLRLRDNRLQPRRHIRHHLLIIHPLQRILLPRVNIHPLKPENGIWDVEGPARLRRDTLSACLPRIRIIRKMTTSADDHLRLITAMGRRLRYIIHIRRADMIKVRPTRLIELAPAALRHQSLHPIIPRQTQ